MNTWGISGPAFLALYSALLAATVGAVALAAWLDGRRRGGLRWDLDEYEVAMLNGGGELVASVALLNLDRAGVIELGDRLLRDLAETNELDLATLTGGDLDELGVGMQITVLGEQPRHPLEQAVHRAVRDSDGRTPEAAIGAAVTAAEFEALRQKLVMSGLLRSPVEQERQRLRWTFFLPVLGLGLVRMAYGLSRGRPVLYLVLLLGATVAAAVVTARSRSERTSRGTGVLAEVRREAPDPIETIDGAVDSRAPELGLAVALAGAAALWGSNPALAAAVGAPEEPARHNWWQRGGDGAWFGGCGGAGGCGSGGGCGGGGGGGCGG